MTAVCRLVFSRICPIPFHSFFCTMQCSEVAFPLTQTSPFSPGMPKYVGLTFYRETAIQPMTLCAQRYSPCSSQQRCNTKINTYSVSLCFWIWDHHVGAEPLQSRCGAKSAPVLRDAGDSESSESRFPYTPPFPRLSQQVIAVIVPHAVTVPRYTILYVCSLYNCCYWCDSFVRCFSNHGLIAHIIVWFENPFGDLPLE